jgi:hypothetical protein
MGDEDVSQLTYDEIYELCKHCSWGTTKSRRGLRDIVSRVTKSCNGGGVTKDEIGNMLDNFKIDILSTLISQLDTFQDKRKKEEIDLALAIFCSRCRKKHPLWECPLDNVEVCGICEKNHATKYCPSLPELKAVYQRDNEET